MVMRFRPAFMRSVARLMLAGGLAGGLAACSSDTVRFSDSPYSDNPFGNPFEPLTGGGQAHGPVASRAVAPAMAARRAPVMAQNLPPVGQVSAAPLPPVGSAPIAAAPMQTATAIPAADGVKGWTAQGGSPVKIGSGETVQIVAARYGVPEPVLRAVNGLSAAGQPAPGATIIVPVYRPDLAVAVPSRVVAPASAVSVPLAPPAASPVAAAPAAQPKLPLAMGTEIAVARPGAVLAQVARDIEIARMDAAKSAEAAAGKTAPAVKAGETAPAVKAGETALSAAKPAGSAKPAAEETTASLATAAKPSAEFRWPAKGRIITGFGNKGGGNNDGINIALPEGTPVKAAEGGVVAYAGNELKGYGNLVLIRHPDGYVSAYAHNGELKVKRGDTVQRGQVVAVSGQSGNVSSPQLHFELRKGSTPVDPVPYLSGN